MVTVKQTENALGMRYVFGNKWEEVSKNKNSIVIYHRVIPLRVRYFNYFNWQKLSIKILSMKKLSGEYKIDLFVKLTYLFFCNKDLFIMFIICYFRLKIFLLNSKINKKSNYIIG